MHCNTLQHALQHTATHQGENQIPLNKNLRQLLLKPSTQDLVKKPVSFKTDQQKRVFCEEYQFLWSFLQNNLLMNTRCNPTQKTC